MNKAYLANKDSDYERLSIKKGTPAIWENGMRTNGGIGSFECWYTDAEFEDGTTIVVGFSTKNGFDINSDSSPTVVLDITFPSGEQVSRTVTDGFGYHMVSSVEKCEIYVNKSFLKCVNGVYHLRFDDGDIRYEATMKSQLPMWRPETGHWYFGNKKFCWLVAQPSAFVDASLNYNGKVANLKGIGYHDHNWGDVVINKTISHWYRGRAKLDEYDILACDIVTEKKYGNSRIPVMMIAKNGKILEDSHNKTAVINSDKFQMHIGNRFMDKNLTYTQSSINKDEKYTLEYTQDKEILIRNILDITIPNKKSVLKSAFNILGISPKYVRTQGDIKLTVDNEGDIKQINSKSLWEQIYF